MGALAVGLLFAAPFLALLVIYLFFRSIVRSGVQQAQRSAPPTAHPAPEPPRIVAAGLTEADVRRIVRDELRAVQAEAAARRGGSPGATRPETSPSPSR